MENEKSKTVAVVKTLFRSMEQSLEDMEKVDFEMNSAALAEKVKTLARFLKEETQVK